mgnify:CR=1 FL=1
MILGSAQSEGPPLHSACPRCQGRLFPDEDTLACLYCGNRIYLSAPLPLLTSKQAWAGGSGQEIKRELAGELPL